jgi:hypothetical protein
MYRADLLIDRFLEDEIDFLLQEMYKKPLLDIIDTFVHDILHSNLDSNTIYEKHRIYIDLVEPGKNPKDKRLVYNGYYNPLHNTYRFEIRDDIDTLGDVDSALIQELKEIYVHEETHEQQNQGKNRLQPYDNGDGDLEKYLSQYQEIPAMARSIAYTLKIKTNLDYKEVIRAIINDDTILQTLPDDFKIAIKLYRNINGKVWREFLKQAYVLLSSIENTYLGAVEYRQWLKDHSL